MYTCRVSFLRGSFFRDRAVAEPKLHQKGLSNYLLVRSRGATISASHLISPGLTGTHHQEWLFLTHGLGI